MKSREHSESGELNLLPIMNLICLLIPFLLITAQFVKVGIILVETPRTTRGPGRAAPKEALDLTVVMTAKGYYLKSRHGAECPVGVAQDDRLCFRRQGGRLDEALLKRLQHHLWTLYAKKYRGEEHYAQPSERHAITLIPEPDVRYEDIVRTLDAMRDIPADAKDPPPPVAVPTGGCSLARDRATGTWAHALASGMSVQDSACMYHRVTLALNAL